MKIFLDFDDVIFNTKNFIVEYEKIFLKNGILDGFAPSANNQVNSKKINKKRDLYDPKRRFKLIEKRSGKKLPRLRKDLEQFLKKLSPYNFEDSLNFLNNFRKNELYLISYGDEKFQKAKIIGSGTKHFFQKIMITDRMKSVAIKEILRKNRKSEKIFFIDDRIEHINAVKKGISSIITFHMKRKQGRYSDYSSKNVDYCVKDFRQAEKIITKLNGI